MQHRSYLLNFHTIRNTYLKGHVKKKQIRWSSLPPKLEHGGPHIQPRSVRHSESKERLDKYCVLRQCRCCDNSAKECDTKIHRSNWRPFHIVQYVSRPLFTNPYSTNKCTVLLRIYKSLQYQQMHSTIAYLLSLHGFVNHLECTE
jgi:hypothetical protein